MTSRNLSVSSYAALTRPTPLPGPVGADFGLDFVGRHRRQWIGSKRFAGGAQALEALGARLLAQQVCDLVRGGQAGFSGFLGQRPGQANLYGSEP